MSKNVVLLEHGPIADCLMGMAIELPRQVQNEFQVIEAVQRFECEAWLPFAFAAVLNDPAQDAVIVVGTCLFWKRDDPVSRAYGLRVLLNNYYRQIGTSLG